ncbi:MAG TPA: hypothetical protein VM914_07330 [Pyrinomonadaceae bacterium]|jgi:hypothetical protein|nr:hypothetical protein [Pyrinomonadaceae bacterium]
MRTSRLATFARVALACVLTCVAALAQDNSQEKQVVRAPNRLVVQVEYFKGAPLSYMSVPNGSWFGRFGLTPAASTRAPADTVLAVDVKTRMLDGRVEIKVGVHVGAQHFDRLDEVATYSASAGETVVASDLERFGVEPFRMKVLSVNDTLSAAPTIVNKTQSIEAVVSKFEPQPLPRAVVTLRNLSSKRVLAVELRQVVDGRERIISSLMERDGKVLMEPGGTYDRKVGATTGHSTQDEFTPTAVESVVIASAVFDDYTYEGEVGEAARKRAMDEGERLQLPRIVALLRAARAARGPVTAETLKQFRERLTAIDDLAPARSLDAIMKAYPELKQEGRGWVESAFAVSMHESKRELLDDLKRFEAAFARDPGANDFRAWLKPHQERFEQWLARL